MRPITRRTVLASGTAAAATALAPISAIRPAAADTPCLRPLRDFLAEAGTLPNRLSGAQRGMIVDQAIELLQNMYVHLPLKQRLYGVDPIGALNALRPQVDQFNSDPPFHAAMMKIFTSLHDMHTRYQPPAPYSTAHAFLPFKVEACGPVGQRKHIVSRVAPGFEHPTFRPGVEVLSWNGVPIEQAADDAGGEGATDPARRALGLARLTYRTLQLQAAPQEDSVLVHYRDDSGREADVEKSWRVLTQLPNACQSSCNEIQHIQEFRKFLYAPYYLCTPFAETERIVMNRDVFGYIRIYSFEVSLLGDDPFVGVFRNLVASFANATNLKGLIIDVRDNGGGSTRASERIVQWVSPAARIEPSQLYFRATDVTSRFCQLGAPVSDLGPDGLRPWIPSIELAKQTGKTFSDAFSYTSKDRCNSEDRVIFRAPVIVVTSAMTFSAAEFFAACFQDHGGKILGVDETTGGGGAGVRTDLQLRKYFTDAGQPSPYIDLARAANGAGFQVAFRRTKRVGLNAGKDIEDIGVQRNLSYAMTRDDLLYDNRDLKKEAIRLLMTP